MAQAAATIAAMRQYGELIEPFGFTMEDLDLLQKAHLDLEEADLSQDGKLEGRKVVSSEYLRAMDRAASVRKQGRAVMKGLSSKLKRSGRVKHATALQVCLDETSVQGDDATALSAQLQRMATAMSEKAIADMVAARKAQPTIDLMRATASPLKAMDTELVTSRTKQTDQQTLDLLDGIILELCRNAYEAARAAAEEHGSAIKKAFALVHLPRHYSASKKPKAPKSPPKNGPGTTPGEPKPKGPGDLSTGN